jgi:hypothetical protein
VKNGTDICAGTIPIHPEKAGKALHFLNRNAFDVQPVGYTGVAKVIFLRLILRLFKMLLKLVLLRYKNSHITCRVIPRLRAGGGVLCQLLLKSLITILAVLNFNFGALVSRKNLIPYS